MNEIRCRQHPTIPNEKRIEQRIYSKGNLWRVLGWVVDRTIEDSPLFEAYPAIRGPVSSLHGSSEMAVAWIMETGKER